MLINSSIVATCVNVKFTSSFVLWFTIEKKIGIMYIYYIFCVFCMAFDNCCNSQVFLRVGLETSITKVIPSCIEIAVLPSSFVDLG